MAPKANKWIGIDLGTYNSSAAMKKTTGRVEIVHNTGGKQAGLFPLARQEKCKEFPSFLSFCPDGTLEDVGIGSKRKAESEPGQVVWGVKRLLGKPYTELKASGELDRFPFRIRPDRSNGQCLIVLGEKAYSPLQLCSLLLKKIKDDAEVQFGSGIESAVISVPAYFDPLRVTPIVEAARLAGFHHIKTIPEPVAAALAYQLEIGVKPMNVLVFDLGAGTLDVTTGCLYHNPGQLDDYEFHVMKNTGDPCLGGIDIDDRIMRLITEQCKLPELPPEERAVLRKTAESAKIRLSTERDIEQAFVVNNREYQYRLTQYDLRQAMAGDGKEKNLLEECRRQVVAAIRESGWNTRDVELVLMIGGPTRLPCIHEVLCTIFHDVPSVLQQLDSFYAGDEKVDRMAAVSMGAALSVDYRVNDKVPYGHGFNDLRFNFDEVAHVPVILIPRDSPYPYKSGGYELGWTNSSGLFQIDIIQRVPDSEVPQLGYEYRFMGVLKFAVKYPDDCRVLVQMGYTKNKELEVTIRNIMSDESVTYIGINQYACIGIKYPQVAKRPMGIGRSLAQKPEPSEESLDRFILWAWETIGYMQQKIASHPVPQMLLCQILEETRGLLAREDPQATYESVYTNLNSLIWNANSKGVLSRSEHSELATRISEFERILFY